MAVNHRKAILSVCDLHKCKVCKTVSSH